jgi:hypothetical protein
MEVRKFIRETKIFPKFYIYFKNFSENIAKFCLIFALGENGYFLKFVRKFSRIIKKAFSFQPFCHLEVIYQ